MYYPCVGEVHLLVEEIRLFTVVIKEQYLPKQSEKLSSPEEAVSDQWDTALWGEENLTPTGLREQGVNLFMVKLDASDYAGLTLARVLGFLADFIHLNVEWKFYLGMV